MGVSWFEATGRGTIYSFTICYRGPDSYRDLDSYILAYVELDEGPRVMTNVVTDEVSSVHVGDVVQAVFHDTGAGTSLLRFRPVRE